jgi:serine protease Do
MEDNNKLDQENSPKTKARVSSMKSSRTITITIPKVNLPKVRINQLISKGQALLLVVVLVIGVGGGFIGGWLESSGYRGKILTATTSNQIKTVSSNNQLITDIVNKLEPSVVSIDAVTTTVSSNNIFGLTQPVQSESEGTGIIISSNGLVLTNRHVVPAGTTSVSIILNNGMRLKDVSVVGRTSTSDSLDIAILKINNTMGQTLTPAVIGNSSNVQVGDEVVAIGNALGQFHNTVTSGIISGYGRNITASSSGGSNNPFLPSLPSTSENLNDMFQTDAAINKGNSGGPLVNMNGQVIGVNTAVASNSQNIGFAIPINEVKGLIKEVINTGQFKRPFLGVRYIPLTLAIAKKYNLKVDNGAYIPKGSSSTPSIIAGSAAAKAGLKPGDVITKVNSTPVNELNDLSTLIDLYEPGSKVTLTIVKGSTTKQVSVILGGISN